jgi:diaminopimelate decarboxylase
MDFFNYKDTRLHAEDVDLTDIAGRFGTPCYVYSRATLERHWRAFDDAFGTHDHLVCYAVKANSNIAILNLLARLGSGFDIVSVGELERVLAAGGDPGKVVFSGVGKRADEMQRALEAGIYCFNIESIAELELLDRVAGECGITAPVSVRVNPDVDAGTHPYIATGLRENKFGIDIKQAEDVYVAAANMPNIAVHGVDCHIGSQLTDTAPFVEALQRVLALVKRLENKGLSIRHIDLGGGLGIRYRDEAPPEPRDYMRDVMNALDGRDYKLLIEPGRAIIGNAGVLLTRVEYLKPGDDKSFAIVDAAMNDLLRPSLYQAWQDIVPVDNSRQDPPRRYDVVGPVCETGDFLGKDRDLAIERGDLLAVRSAGAYGFAMSSNYNSRPRAAEVLVDGDQVHLIRRREAIRELFEAESLIASD